MKYSYKSVLFCLSAVVCIGCNPGSNRQQTLQKKFTTIWESKGKDSIIQYLKKYLNILDREAPKHNISPTRLESLKQECIKLSMPQVDKYIQQVKVCCLKLPDQELERLVDKLEKSQNAFETLRTAVPEPQKSQIEECYVKYSNELIKNSLDFISKEDPNILNNLKELFPILLKA